MSRRPGRSRGCRTVRPFGLSRSAADLGEPAVWGVADGTRDALAHGVAEALLDLVREGHRDIAGRHRGGELVNGAHGVDGQHVENRRDDTVVDARIEIGPLGDQRDPRAPAAGVGDGHAGRDPGALGEGVGGDHAALDGPGERDDPEGPALQLAVGLFFAGGKEAIEINVQLLWGGGLPHTGTIANKKRIYKVQEQGGKVVPAAGQSQLDITSLLAICLANIICEGGNLLCQWSMSIKRKPNYRVCSHKPRQAKRSSSPATASRSRGSSVASARANGNSVPGRGGS